MPMTDLFQTPLDAASSLVGANEKDAAVADFLSTGGANLDPQTQAWCAAFVNASLGHAGQQGTGAMNARSFMNWGQDVDQPQRGDVAVFSRGDPNGWQGHVGFYEGTNPDGTFNILGGNQGDSVSLARMDPNSLLGFRRGEGTPGFNPNAPAPVSGLGDLFIPPAAPAAPTPPEADPAVIAKRKQLDLYNALPGLSG